MTDPLALEPLFPDRETGEPLAVQLARRLRDAIEAGTLPAGSKMLGTRELARRLGLGRNTVALAFEHLIAEGYLAARGGSGTYVAAAGIARQRARRVHPEPAQPTQARRFAAMRSHFETATADGPLRPGMPSLASFPAAAWRRTARQALDVYDGALGYGPSSGLRALREAIAMHVRTFRGISAHPEQIVVVEGAQAALHLASIVLARAGERVAIEDPCYALARAAFEAASLRLRPVPVDREGLRTDRLPRDARFAFVTPTHQFPLGGTLSLARRRALLDWAKQHDAYVVEDDYDSEFTSRARPLAALQSLDTEERVIYVGSFSKTLAPGLRAGYLIAPPHLARAFRAARACTSLGLSLHLQATLARFITEGHFARHIRRMNAIYEERRTLLVHALESLTTKAFDLGPMHVGLHVALVAKRSIDDRALAAFDDGQRLLALSSLCLARKDLSGFVLGFTNGSDDEIARAAARVAATLHSCDDRAGRVHAASRSISRRTHRITGG